MTRFRSSFAPKATDPATWFDLDITIQSSVVYMAFVASGSYSPELAAHLAQRNMIIAGNVPRPAPEVTQRWAATVQFDSAAALEEIWSAVSAGNGGQMANANIKVVDSNPSYFPSRACGWWMALADLKGRLAAAANRPWRVTLPFFVPHEFGRGRLTGLAMPSRLKFCRSSEK